MDFSQSNAQLNAREEQLHKGDTHRELDNGSSTARRFRFVHFPLLDTEHSDHVVVRFAVRLAIWFVCERSSDLLDSGYACGHGQAGSITLRHDHLQLLHHVFAGDNLARVCLVCFGECSSIEGTHSGNFAAICSFVAPISSDESLQSARPPN